MDFEGAKNYLIPILKKGLDKRLHYHGIHHTYEVIEAATRLGELEQISSDDMILLKTAALFHDSGHLYAYTGHEDFSQKLVSETLPSFGYSENQIKEICKIIASTKIPQSPKNLLSKILCDADLDYLGTDKFDPIAYSLFEELTAMGFIQGNIREWNIIQLGFLTKHHYFTKAAKKTRLAKKTENVKKIQAIVKSYSVDT
jgi:hypothetical protein